MTTKQKYQDAYRRARINGDRRTQTIINRTKRTDTIVHKANVSYTHRIAEVTKLERCWFDNRIRRVIIDIIR